MVVQYVTMSIFSTDVLLDIMGNIDRRFEELEVAFVAKSNLFSLF